MDDGRFVSGGIGGGGVRGRSGVPDELSVGAVKIAVLEEVDGSEKSVVLGGEGEGILLLPFVEGQF